MALVCDAECINVLKVALKLGCVSVGLAGLELYVCIPGLPVREALACFRHIYAMFEGQSNNTPL
jgi:hypothetical protein